MLRITAILMSAGTLLLCGCRTTETATAQTDPSESMLHLGAELRPETLLFPEYLLMPDFEIDQHGRIPGTTTIGAGMKTALDLDTTRERFDAVLSANGWETVAEEKVPAAFRLTAEREPEKLEIRAVQGTGPTQVFLLYQPEPGPLL